VADCICLETKIVHIAEQGVLLPREPPVIERFHDCAHLTRKTFALVNMLYRTAQQSRPAFSVCLGHAAARVQALLSISSAVRGAVRLLSVARVHGVGAQAPEDLRHKLVCLEARKRSSSRDALARRQPLEDCELRGIGEEEAKACHRAAAWP
jgi:hypothetical protein